MKGSAERIKEDISKTYNTHGMSSALKIAFHYEKNNPELFSGGYCPQCEVNSTEVEHDGCVICGTQLTGKPSPAPRYVPIGLNGVYFVYDDQEHRIPLGYGSKGGTKKHVQAECDVLNKEEQNEEGAMEIAYENTYGKGIDPKAAIAMRDALLNIEPTLIEQLFPEFWENEDIIEMVKKVKAALLKAKHPK